MAWEVLIIPLIAFGMWILSTLLKSEDEKASQPGPRRLDGRLSPRPARQPATALDSFLEEARRRRAAGTEPSREATRPAPPPIIAPRRPSPRPTGPRRPPVIATVVEEPPVVVRREVVIEAVPEALVVLQPSASLPPAPSAPVVKRDRPLSLVLLEVMRLLRSPQTAGAAVVLREILDRPLGRWRR